MYSILAGIVISFGCIIFLQVGGVLGATMFSIGLITVLILKLNLFTGKAGLLATNQITWWQLILIWIGNFYGCAMMAAAIMLTPLGASLGTSAAAIAAIRLANGPLANLILGICCGALMSIAVGLFGKKDNPLYAIMPVTTFICSGYNHCVADMFYFSVCGASPWVWLTLLPTTLGNILGCYLIPAIQNWHENNYPHEK